MGTIVGVRARRGALPLLHKTTFTVHHSVTLHGSSKMDMVKNTVKNLVEKGVFGPVKFSSVSFSDSEKNLTHFASVINFFEINVGESETIKAVLKRSPQFELTRAIFNSDLQFRNELLMYNEIIPFLKCENIVPKFYHGECSVDKNEYLILEDLKSQGYRLAKHTVFLDLKHLSIAVEKLGKFHGYSYKAKKQNGSEFQKLHQKLSLFDDRDKKEYNFMIYHSMMRGITPLSGNEELKKLVEKMSDMDKLSWMLQDAEEPFGVVCHGDFNRNNMFFKYENEEPTDVRFFDFQTSRYKSPAVDLSFLLYMNTDVEMRKEWDYLLGVYWKGVTSVEPDPGFTFERFCEHFAQKALHGYLPCSFFLPTMMDPDDGIEIESTANFTIEERMEVMLQRGGDKGTQALIDIIQHLIERGYIQAFNNSY